jgi:hypothetical protein
LAAFVCVGDSSSSAPDCTSTSPAVALSAHEIAQLDACLMPGILHRQVLLVLRLSFFGIEQPPPPSPGTSPWLLILELLFI